MIHPDDLDRATEGWERARALGEPITIEFRLRDREGRYRWFLSRALPIHDDSGRVMRWYGTSTDIDAQKRDAEALVSVHAALQRADSRKDQFLATLGHELRNPLAPLRNGIQLLELNANDSTGKVRSMMRRQIEHMTRSALRLKCTPRCSSPLCRSITRARVGRAVWASG